jgi:hypothetical protein
MSVREHDRARVKPLKFPQPIETAIDYYVCTAIRDQHRGVHPVPSRACFDFTARAEERQFHW